MAKKNNSRSAMGGGGRNSSLIVVACSNYMRSDNSRVYNVDNVRLLRT